MTSLRVLLHNINMKCKQGILLLCLLAITCGEKKQSAAPADIPGTARVMMDDLRIRISPNTMAAEIGRLKRESSVKILQRSTDKVKIGSHEAHWYQVATPDGLKGWVYGAYLDIEAAADVAKVVDKMKEKIADMTTGRWYAMRRNGGLTDFFLTLYADGSFDSGNGKKITSQGNYNLEISGNIGKITLSDEKNPLKNLQVELRGETLSFKGMLKDSEITFSLADKTPKPFDEEKP